MEASQKAIFLWKVRFRESSFMVKFLSERGALDTYVFQGSKGIKKGQLAQPSIYHKKLDLQLLLSSSC